MTTGVFFAVLFSAFFQAGWNFFAKRSKAHPVALLAVGWFLFGFLTLPSLFWVLPSHIEHPVQDIVFYCFLSAGIHAVYLCFLGWAYAIGEISVVYPIARGLGIAGTAIVSLLLALHPLSLLGASGVATVVLGTLLIGIKEWSQLQHRKPFLVAILVGISISSYSICDSYGAKVVPLPIFIIFMNLVAPILASPFLWFKYKREALGVALAGSIAYGIVLLAFSKSPTTYVATIREFSVVIAALLGMIVLRERVYFRKVLGICLIVCGIALIKFA